LLHIPDTLVAMLSHEGSQLDMQSYGSMFRV